MIEKLFVYGTLAPNCPNEHILTVVGGSWESATIIGTLLEKGWGAEMGFPGIILDKQGDEIEGFVFTSDNLSNHWAELDAFEGEGYSRVLSEVKVENGDRVLAYVYALK